jgi:nucleotide-binding universal stress UspA family protein
MSGFNKILVPIDFSEYSEYALTYANAFVQKFGGTIDCVHVVDMGFLNDGAVDGVYVSSADLHRSTEAIKAEAQKHLDHFVKKEHLLGTDITPHLTTGYAGEEITQMAGELGCDLIIIATHGRSGLDHLVFGSTCDKVVRTSLIPVLAIKHPEHEALNDDGSLKINSILCPLDFSEFSHSAIPMAAMIAGGLGAKLTLAHVVDARFDYPEWTAQVAINNSQELAKSAEMNLEKAAAELDGIETEIYVTIGVPHRALNEKIKEDNIDLVVMPTHGRKGIAHALLGSVSEKMVRTSACPVMIVRPTK